MKCDIKIIKCDNSWPQGRARVEQGIVRALYRRDLSKRCQTIQIERLSIYFKWNSLSDLSSFDEDSMSPVVVIATFHCASAHEQQCRE